MVSSEDVRRAYGKISPCIESLTSQLTTRLDLLPSLGSDCRLISILLKLLHCICDGVWWLIINERAIAPEVCIDPV